MPLRRACWASALALAACEIGDVTPRNPGGGGEVDAGPGGGADADPGGGGGGSLSVTFTPSPSPTAVYAPSAVLAAWVQTPANAFVKTIGRWSATRTQHLVAWNQAAGAGDTDAVSGATVIDATPRTATWDLLDRQAGVVAPGTYTLRLESADRNATTPAENNQGTFSFTVGAAPETQTGLASGGFSAVSITFTPAP